MSERATVRAYLALGSNLSDRLANLQRAADLLDGTAGIRVARSSSVYETAPVGPPQPDYLNAVLEVATTRSPRTLLEACLDVEERMGRVRLERWGPRVIDIDVLTYDDERVVEEDLTIPHPRMAERAFVLVPLADLDDDAPPAPDAGEVRPFGPPLTIRPPGG